MIDNKLKKEILLIVIGDLLYNIFALVFSIMILIFFKPTGFNINDIVIGYLIGFIFSVIYIYHMAMSINKAIDYNDEKSANGYFIRQKVIRYFLLIMIFILINKYLNSYISIFAIISVFGIKIGAYIAPLIKYKRG